MEMGSGIFVFLMPHHLCLRAIELLINDSGRGATDSFFLDISIQMEYPMRYKK